MKYSIDSVYFRRYIKNLFSFLGDSTYEVRQPEGGWPAQISRSFYVDADAGKFFLQSDGKISYKSKAYQLTNWNFCPKILTELSVDQFENYIKCKITYQTARTKVPNIEWLMCKFYELEQE